MMQSLSAGRRILWTSTVSGVISNQAALLRSSGRKAWVRGTGRDELDEVSERACFVISLRHKMLRFENPFLIRLPCIFALDGLVNLSQ